jgi:hypothetical protein
MSCRCTNLSCVERPSLMHQQFAIWVQLETPYRALINAYSFARLYASLLRHRLHVDWLSCVM